MTGRLRQRFYQPVCYGDSFGALWRMYDNSAGRLRPGGIVDEGFCYGGCEDIDFFWRVQQAGFTASMTGSVLIHHFSMVTRDTIEKTETRVYIDQNLAHFVKKWKRTVRGNWLQRRWGNVRVKCERGMNDFGMGIRS